MLARFEVENYRGFQERVILDLTNVRNYEFNPQCIRDGKINKALIVGRNGCGKTNLGLALFDIVGTLTDRGIDNLMRDPSSFINGDSGKPSATFVYVFDENEKRIRYEYRKTAPEMIVYERMDVDGSMLFERDGKNLRKNEFDSIAAENLRMDIPNGRLSVLRYIANNTVQPVGSPITAVMSFASNMLYFRSVQDGNSYAGLVKGGEELEEYILREGLEGDFQRFLHEMTGLNISLGHIEVAKGVLFQKTETKGIPFGAVASSGTKALLLFYYWMKHFKGLKLLYMDEFDAYYHFELAEKVLRLVRDMDDFQTILTSHNTALLSSTLMRPDCFLQMDNGKIESFTDLTERELRMGHNLEKMYRNGEFDA